MTNDAARDHHFMRLAPLPFKRWKHRPGWDKGDSFSPFSRERLFLVISLESLQEVSTALKRAFPLDISSGTERLTLVSRSLGERTLFS